MPWILRERPTQFRGRTYKSDRYDRFIAKKDRERLAAHIMCATRDDLLQMRTEGRLWGEVLEYTERKLLDLPTYILTSTDCDDRGVYHWTDLWQGTWKAAVEADDATGEEFAIIRVAKDELLDLYRKGAASGHLKQFVKQHLLTEGAAQ